MNHGRPVSVDALVDMLWPDGAPPGVSGTLQAYVAGLRRSLEPDRAARAPSTVLVTVAPGYALRVAEDALDAARFDRAVSRAHRRIGQLAGLHAPSGLSTEELTAVVAELDEALALWRGTPYLELEDAPSAVAERARLEELRVVALEDRAVAALELGQHATVAGELESLTTAYPLRERLWGLRALALTRAGRQAEALDALREVRDVLADELGLEPGQELRDLQSAVLRQDPAIDWQPASTPSPAAAPVSATSTARIQSFVPTLPPWPLVGRADQLADLVGALEQAESGSVGVGRAGRRAGHRQEPAGRGAGQGGRRARRDGAARPVLPGRRRPAALAVAAGAAVARARAARGERAGRGRRRPVPHAGRRSPARWRRRRPSARSSCCSTTCTGPTSRRCGCCGCSARRCSRAGCWSLGTWRSHPEPTDALLDAVETFARRHAVRLDLTRPQRRRRRRASSRRSASRRRPTPRRPRCESAPTATPSSSSSTPGWRARVATCPG